MDREETLKIMSVMKAAYPQYYRDMSRADADGIVALWTDLFADDPYPVVAAALKALLSARTSTFPPVIGEVKAKVNLLTQPVGMSEQEVWALVSKAVRNTDPTNPSKQYNKLPQVIQKALGSANTLREWGTVDEDEFSTVVSSNFMRSFKTIQNRETEYSALPADVKALIGGISNRLSLTEG